MDKYPACRHTNPDENSEVCELVQELKKFIHEYPDEYSANHWIAAMMFLYIQSHKISCIPYEVLEQSIMETLDFYKDYYLDKSK